MEIKTLNNQLDLVQDCYEKASLAQSKWNEYRRIAGAHNEPTPDIPEFLSLLKKLAETAEEINRRRERVSHALYGVGIVQAEIYSDTGRCFRRVVVERPDAKISEPHISRTSYRALALMLGERMHTTAPFDIAVIDDFGRVSDRRIPSRK